MAAPKAYTVDVNGHRQTTQTYTVLPGAQAETLRFRLPAGNKVELTDHATKLGPKSIQVKKVGEDLHLAFPGSSLRNPDVIIEGFYPAGGKAGALIGKGSGGKAYDYAGVSGGAALEKAGLTAALAGKPVSEWGDPNAASEPVFVAERAANPAPPAGPAGGSANASTASVTTNPAPTSASATPARDDAEGFRLGPVGWVLGGLGLAGLAAAGAGGGGGGGGRTATNVSDGPVSRVEPGAIGPEDDRVVEGQTLVYTVTLRDPSTTPTSWSYALGGTASPVDLADIQISDGVTLANGILTVPAGVQSFTISLRTANDTTIEAHEEIVLSVQGVSAAATLLDDDKPSVVTVEPGAPGTADDRVVEGAPIELRVTLGDLSPKPETYRLSVGGGASPADYSVQALSDGVSYDPTTGLITVPAQVGAFTLTLATVVDAVAEPSEAYLVSVDSTQGSATVADLLPASVTAAATTEGAALVYTVTLNGSSASPSAHAFELVAVSATAGADFGTPVFSDGVSQPAPGLLSVPAGVTRFTVTVPTLRDNAVEADETLRLSVDGLSALGTIAANGSQSVSAVSPSAAAVAEGGGVSYAVTLSGPSNKVETHVFKINEQAATAFGTLGLSNGVSYNPATQQLSIPAGVTAFTVSLNTANNARDDLDQALSVSLGGVVNALSLRDDDPAPVLSLTGPANFTEGAGTAAYTVSLSQASGQAVSVAYATGNGSAVAGSDFAASSGTLNFAPGTTTQTITVNVTNDAQIELDESFTVALSGPVNATLGAASLTTTLVDNDRQAVTGFAAAAGSVTEGGTLLFNATLNAPSPRTETYTLQQGGTASGADLGALTATNGVTVSGQTLSVPAGVTAFQLRLPTVDDAQIELTETMQLTLAGRGASVSVLDNEPPPVLSLAGPAQVNEAAGTAAYTVTLSQASAVDVKVNYGATGGTANAADFTPVAGTLTLAAGTTSGRIVVPITSDGVDENEQSFQLALSAPVNATLGSASRITTSIVDDDTQTVSGAAAVAGTVIEGGTVQFTVTLSTVAEGALTHAFALGGTATLGSDYLAPSFSNGVTYDAARGVVTVPAGIGSFTVSMPTRSGDGLEFAETVQITVGGRSAEVLIPLNFGSSDPALALADDGTQVLVLTDGSSGQAPQLVYADAGGASSAGMPSAASTAPWVELAYSAPTPTDDLLATGAALGPAAGA